MQVISQLLGLNHHRWVAPDKEGIISPTLARLILWYYEGWVIGVPTQFAQQGVD